MGKIPKIKEVSPRELWPNEEKDFTPWLQKNFQELGEMIGINATNIRRERRTGDFRVDLIGEEVSSGHKIIVENQLMPTDHNHLGQLLTYASGLDANIIIWVSSEFRVEHKHALSWLNSITSEDISFFGVRIKTFKIDNQIGYDFDLVVQPEEWAPKRRAYSEKRQRYGKFYTDLLRDLREKGITSASKGNADTFQGMGFGWSGAYLEFRFTTEGMFRVAFYIVTSEDNSKTQLFDPLFEQKKKIEKDFGGSLAWERRDKQKHSTISIYIEGTIDDESSLDSLKEWAVEQTLKMKQALEPHRDLWKI